MTAVLVVMALLMSQTTTPIRNFLRINSDFCTGGQPTLQHLEQLKAEGINELLFLNNIFAAHTPFHISNIKGLMVPGSPKGKP